MSYTIEENEEFRSQFMAAWKDNQINSAGDQESIKQSLRAVALAVKSAEDNHRETIKLARGIIMEAENAIDDLCEPLRAIEKVAHILLLDYAERTAQAKPEAKPVRLPAVEPEPPKPNVAPNRIPADPVEAVIEAIDKPKPKRKKKKGSK